MPTLAESFGTPDRMTFHTWAAPPANHPILSNLQCRPILRVQIDQTTTPTACAAALLALAQQIGADRFGGPAYSLFVQNLGSKWGPTRGPLSAGLDALASPTPHAPVPAAASMFTTNGRAASLATFRAYFAAIKSAFDAASMPLPARLAQDDEDVDGAGYGNAFVPARIVGRADASAVPVGIWQPSLNDARAQTEIVTPGLRVGDADMTLDAWERARLQAGITFDPVGFEYIQNAAFRDWFNVFSRYSWCVAQTAYAAAREHFAGIVCSNYGSCIGNANTRDFFNPRFMSGQRRTFDDALAPVLYSPNLNNLAAAGLQTTLDPSAQYRAWVIGQREQHAAAMLSEHASNHKPHVCWVQLPGQPLTNAHTPSVEDVAQAIAGLSALGDSDVHIWADPSVWNAGGWDSLGLLIARVNQLTNGRRRRAWMRPE